MRDLEMAQLGPRQGESPRADFYRSRGTERRRAQAASELSGGMKQRVGIARALSITPKIMLMDEPFSALDALTRGTLQDEVRRICLETGQTAFMITHDVDEAIYLADKIFLMTNGPGAVLAEIVENPLQRIAAAPTCTATPITTCCATISSISWSAAARRLPPIRPTTIHATCDCEDRKTELMIASVSDASHDHSKQASWPGLSRPSTSSKLNRERRGCPAQGRARRV